MPEGRGRGDDGAHPAGGAGAPPVPCGAGGRRTGILRGVMAGSWGAGGDQAAPHPAAPARIAHPAAAPPAKRARPSSDRGDRCSDTVDGGADHEDLRAEAVDRCTQRVDPRTQAVDRSIALAAPSTSRIDSPFHCLEASDNGKVLSTVMLSTSTASVDRCTDRIAQATACWTTAIHASAARSFVSSGATPASDACADLSGGPDSISPRNRHH